MTTRTAATANVVRLADATCSGSAAVMSLVPAARAKRAPMTDAPVIRPRLRARFVMPDTRPLSAGRTPPMTAVLLAAWNTAYPAVTTTSGAR
jgi:hypothetical protein